MWRREYDKLEKRKAEQCASKLDKALVLSAKLRGNFSASQ